MWYATTGQLRAAERTGHQMIGLAERLGTMHLADLAWARLALAEACLQRDELDDAGCSPRRLGPRVRSAAHADLRLTMLARVRLAVGDLSEANEISLAARHEAAYARLPGPTRRPCRSSRRNCAWRPAIPGGPAAVLRLG